MQTADVVFDKAVHTDLISAWLYIVCLACTFQLAFAYLKEFTSTFDGIKLFQLFVVDVWD